MDRLYVGNVPWSTTEAELADHFGVYGELKSVRLITDRDTGRSRGFAFVEFANPDHAEAALAEDGRDLGGRTLRVREATPQPPRDNQRRGGGGGGGNGRKRGRNGGDHDKRRNRSRH